MMRSLGTCSVIVDSQLRCDQKTCAFHRSFSSDSCSACSSFFMYFGKSANCVHWLYTRSRGAPMSRCSTMLVILDFFPPPPFPPKIDPAAFLRVSLTLLPALLKPDLTTDLTGDV